MTSSQGGGGSGGGGGGKYGGPSGGYHRPNYNSDPRHHSYRHFTSRPNNDLSFSSDLEPQQHFSKRAKLHDGGRQDRLVETTGKSFMNNSSAVSTGSTNNVAGIALNAEPVSPQYGGGLSQYISDIESDDDVDVVAQMDKQQLQQQKPLQQEQPPPLQLQQPSQPLPPQPLPPQPLPPQPLLPPPPPLLLQQPAEEKPIKKLMEEEVVEKKEVPPPVAYRMTKEELLLLMERVDHDIAKVELQVNVLKKKEVCFLCIYFRICV